VVFDAAPAEALFARMRTALSNRELRKHLNCHRAQAEQLVAAGILPQVIDQASRGRNAKQRVARDDADALLDNLLGRASRVDQASNGMGDIARVASATGWSMVDIVKALLAGRLVQVECVDPALRFMGVLVNPTEVRSVLSREASADFISADEAERMLGIKRYGVSRFLKLRDPSGAAYLRAHFVRDAEGRRIRVFSRCELARFLDEHTTLTDIAAQSGNHPRWIKPQLDARGIEPIAPKSRAARYFYRRSDLAGIMPL
jgi:hypothetical protein